MNTKHYGAAAAVLLAGAVMLATAAKASSGTDPAAAFRAVMAGAAEKEAHAIALEAYVYGYPRVELARRIHNETRRVSDGQKIVSPRNRFYYFNRLARPGDGRFIKAPNNDTLYGSTYLDLSEGPVVLRVPALGDRTYVGLIVDAAGRVVDRLSRMVSGPGGVDYAFVGPGGAAGLRASDRRVDVEANDLWLLMRVASDGTPADEREAARLLRGFRLAPASDRAMLERDQPNVDVASLPIEPALQPMGGLAFFDVLADMLVRNPVPAQDRGLLARWARIGLRPGQFDESSLSDAQKAGVNRAIADAEKVIAAAQFGIANTVNGWNYSSKIGRTGDDWALNAAIAKGGYGNVAEDSVYYQRSLDAQGAQLIGTQKYRLTFPAGQTPPVGSFWSVTAYDQATFDLPENRIQRYSIGDRTAGLRRNADGSITFALQAEAPQDATLRANWLPVPAGAFYLVMRTYDPQAAILQGEWHPPELETAP